jgi:hypothetical protein
MPNKAAKSLRLIEFLSLISRITLKLYNVIPPFEFTGLRQRASSMPNTSSVTKKVTQMDSEKNEDDI